MGTYAVGTGAKLAMDSALPFDASSEPYEFINESLAVQKTHVETGGIRGTRSHLGDNVSAGVYTVSGTVLMAPTPGDLAKLLPRILGGTPSGTTFPLAETVPSFVMMVDRVTRVFTYAGCKVNRATLRSSSGNPLQLSLDIEALTESVGSAGTFPAITPSTVTPYMHHHAVLTLGGTAREVDNLELTIDNALLTGEHYNSQARTQLPEGDRVVSLSCDLPYTADEVDLYDLAVAGVAGTIVWTNGGYSLTATLPKLQAPARSPVVANRNAVIPLRLEFVARMSGATKELELTNDSTP